MANILDFDAPARQLTALLDGVTDEHLTAKTPCDGYAVGDVLDHLVGLTLAFRWVAEKTPGTGDQAPSASADRLDPDWRRVLPGQLTALAAAWKDPVAYEGMATAGGVTMPAEVMAAVAMDEVVLHSWDLARATGQHYEPDPASTAVVHGFTSAMSEPGEEAGRAGLFGPVVEVPADASLFDQALGFSGRDPSWTP